MLEEERQEPEIPYEGNQFDERGFQDWYGRWSGTLGLDPDPDHPDHHYDYRGAYQANISPQWDEMSASYHWPSEFKKETHPDRYIDNVDTITGENMQSVWDRNDPELKNQGTFVGGLGAMLRQGPSMLTDALPETVGRSIRSGRTTLETGWLDNWIEENRLEGKKAKVLSEEDRKKTWFTMPFTGQKVTYGDAEDAPQNIAYSIANMFSTSAGAAAGLFAGAALAPVTGGASLALLGAAAGGLLAGTTTSMGASKDQFIDIFYEAFKKDYPDITPENEKLWREIYNEINQDANLYGLWEAFPETVGNLLTMGIASVGKFTAQQALKLGAKSTITRISKAIAERAGKSIAFKLGVPVAKASAMLTEEMLTEAWTATKQSAIEAKYGLRDQALSFTDALTEVAPQTLINTAAMGAIAGGTTSALSKLSGAGKEQKAKNALNTVIDKWVSDIETNFQAGNINFDDLNEMIAQMAEGNPVRDRLQKMVDDYDAANPPTPEVWDSATPVRQASEEPGAAEKAAEKAAYPLTDDQGRRYRKFVSGGVVKGNEKLDPFYPDRVYPVDQEEPAAPSRAATDEDMAALKNYLGEYVSDVDQAQPAEMTPEIESIQRVAEAMGVKVAFFTPAENTRLNKTNGVYDHTTGTIFINSRTNRPVITVFGHETFHRLHRAHPDLWEKMSAVSEGFETKFEAFIADQNAGRQKAGYPLLDPTNEKARQEYLADFAGQQFSKPEFWAKLNEKDPTLGRKLAEIVVDLINKVKKSLLGKQVTEATFFREVNTIQDALAETYKEFIRREKKPKGKTIGEILDEGIPAGMGPSEDEKKIAPKEPPPQEKVPRGTSFKMDEDTEAHFKAWLDRVIPDDQRAEVEAAMRRVLADNPEMIEEGKSWPEIRKMSEVEGRKEPTDEGSDKGKPAEPTEAGEPAKEPQEKQEGDEKPVVAPEKPAEEPQKPPQTKKEKAQARLDSYFNELTDDEKKAVEFYYNSEAAKESPSKALYQLEKLVEKYRKETTAPKKPTETEPKGGTAKPETQPEKLSDEQRAFIRKRVEKLGSRENVLKAYPDEKAPVDIYARELADEVYGKPEPAAPPPAEKPKTEPQAPKRYYDERADKIVHVAKGPEGNWSFYRSRKPDKKPGARVRGIKKNSDLFPSWYDTREEAEAALAEYAKERGWKEVDPETAERLRKGLPKPKPPVEIPPELADLAEKAFYYSNGSLFTNALTDEEKKRINSTEHPEGGGWGTASFWEEAIRAPGMAEIAAKRKAAKEAFIEEGRKNRLSEIEVEIYAVDAQGNQYSMKEKADVALDENEKQLDFARRLLECLNT